MLLHKKEDSDTDTGKSLKLTLEEDKDTTKNTEAPVKRSVFKAYTNYSS